MTLGTSRRARAITVPGIVLSQPLSAMTASKRWPRATSSIESAMTSRETSDVFIPDVPIVMTSEIATVLSSIGVAPAARMPSLTCLASARRWKLHGIVSIHVFATPMIGLARSSSENPMPLRYARAAARCGPSVSARLRCLRSKPVAGAEVEVVAGDVGALMGRRRLSGARRGLPARPPARAARRPTVSALGSRRAAALLARQAAEAQLLPLAEAPEVAANLLGVDLPTREGHVGLVDEAVLVAGQRHPLGEHVVGVGEPCAAVGPGLVRERDAVLVEQLAGLREVGDDRLVRVDEVRVRRAGERRERAAPGRAGGERAPDPDEAEVAVHLPLLVVDAGAQERAGALLGAALAARGVGGDRHAGAAGALAPPPPLQPGHGDLPQQRHDHDERAAEGEDHGDAAPGYRPPAARGKKITRSASRGTSSKDLTMRASRRPPPAVVGTAAHIPRSSWRRNSSTRRSSSDCTSTSPSARRTSPCPGFIRSNLTGVIMAKGSRRARGF